MNVSERYSTALEAKNLKVDPLTSFAASDVLGAAGMAAQAHSDAMLLWSLLFQNKTSAKLKVVDMLADKLTRKMIRERWKGNPKTIAQEVLAWHLHGTCQPCGGRGYQLILGTPALSDRLCTHCGGSGKVKFPRGDAYTWLVDEMSRMIASAGGRVMAKLKVQMDCL